MNGVGDDDDDDDAAERPWWEDELGPGVEVADDVRDPGKGPVNPEDADPEDLSPSGQYVDWNPDCDGDLNWFPGTLEFDSLSSTEDMEWVCKQGYNAAHGLWIDQVPTVEPLSCLCRTKRIDIGENGFYDSLWGLHNIERATRVAVWVRWQDFDVLEGFDGLTEAESIHVSSSRLSDVAAFDNLHEVRSIDIGKGWGGVGKHRYEDISGFNALTEVKYLELPVEDPSGFQSLQ